jgi:hypothetical protein
VDQLFADALSLAPSQREAFLASACADDPAVGAEVRSLMAHYDGAEAAGLLETPLLGRHTATESSETGHKGRQESPTVPGYDILGELGRGGMGVVYKARQRGLNRLVALKMLPSALHAGPTELARFRREAEALAQLQHPNIVQVHDVGEHEGGSPARHRAPGSEAGERPPDR